MNKVIIGVMLITLLSAIVGSSSFAAFSDAEESPGNSITAWTEPSASAISFSTEPSASVGSFSDDERSKGNAITIMIQH